MIKKSHFRKGPFFFWLVAVIVLLTLYYFNRDWFDVSRLRDLVADHKTLVILVYLLILSFLGLTFIPSTPFAIGGVLLFSPLEAYFLNLVGILTSSTIVYYFARFLRLSDAFEEKFPQKVEKIKNALQHKELPIIIAWSAFPAVPTDLMIYVASTLNVKVWKALLGVLIGEGILNAIYIFSADFLVA